LRSKNTTTTTAKTATTSAFLNLILIKYFGLLTLSSKRMDQVSTTKKKGEKVKPFIFTLDVAIDEKSNAANYSASFYNIFVNTKPY